MSSIATRLRWREPANIDGYAVRRTALTGLTGLVAVALAVGLGSRGGVGSLALGVAVALGGGLATIFFLSRRYELTLAVLMLYLGLLDGFLKLETGNAKVTLIRDLLLYAIAAGALIRLTAKRTLRPPPFTGWIVAYVAVVLVQVANPANTSLTHALGALRPHLEFIPLFFLGYAVMRTPGRLRAFLLLLLAVTAVNAVVALVQYGLTPAELSGWGPGYSRLINGDGPVLAQRIAFGVGGEALVRPFGLGADIGFSGNLAALAAPAGLALFLLARPRRPSVLLAPILAVPVVVGLVAAQERIAILTAVFGLIAFAALSAVSRRRIQVLLAMLTAAAVAWLAVSVVTKEVGASVTSRFATISPARVVETSIEYKRGSFVDFGRYLHRYPLGAGLGVVGPASSFAGVSSGNFDGENEFNFLILELGYPGLLLAFGLLAGMCVLAAKRVRRVADREARTPLLALTAALISTLVAFAGAPLTSGSPFGPFIWFVAGTLTWWLVTLPKMRPAGLARGPAPSPGAEPVLALEPQLQARAPRAAAPPAARGHVSIAYSNPLAVGEDSIASHGSLLAGALSSATGYEAEHIALSDALGDRGGPDRHTVIQYNPFAYGRRGFAPRAVSAVARLRRRSGLVALLIHEPYVPIEDVRSLVMGGWQRVQLMALCRSVDLVLAASEDWQRRARRFVADGKVHHLPVGSNLPDARAARAASRRELGAAESTLVVAQIGTRHPSRLDGYGPAAAAALAREGHDVMLLNLGAEAPTPRALDGVRILSPGRLSDEELARAIAAADVFLSPSVDGVSTRRTSVMAALQHGVPVVGTFGPGTDRVLREAGAALSLVPIGDLRGFVAATQALAAAPERRREAGEGARELFVREFAWPVIARRLAAILDAAERR